MDTKKRGHSVRLRKVSFICKACKKIYNTPSKLRQHLANVEVRITYFCPPCDAFFDDGHPCNLSGKRCAYCKQLLDTSVSFRNHICFHEEADKVYCKYCGIEIPTQVKSNHLCPKRNIIEEHVGKKTLICIDENHYLCKACNNKFKLSEVLRHLYQCLKSNIKKLMVENKNITQCDICSRYFDSEDELKKHYESVNPKLVYFCPECINFFYRADDHGIVPCQGALEMIQYCVMCKQAINRLKPMEHVCFHTFTKEEMDKNSQSILSDYECFLFLCEYCGKDVPYNLRGDHYRHVHRSMYPGFRKNKNEKICGHCQITFEDITAYRRHKRIHIDMFLCYICGKKMGPGKTKSHLEAHTNIRRHKCTQCDKAFSFKTSLKKHILVHSNETKHKCSTCGKGFKNNYNLKVHMRIHAEVKPFECVICNKTFTTKQWRDNHLKTHKVVETS